MKLHIFIAALLCSQASAATLSILNPLSFLTNAAQFGLDLAKQNADFTYNAFSGGLSTANALSNAAYQSTSQAISTFENNVDNMITRVNQALNNIAQSTQSGIQSVIAQSQQNYMNFVNLAQSQAEAIQAAIANATQAFNETINGAVNEAEDLINGATTTTVSTPTTTASNPTTTASTPTTEAGEAAPETTPDAVSDKRKRQIAQLFPSATRPSYATEIETTANSVLNQVQSTINSFQQLPRRLLIRAHDNVTNLLNALENMLASQGLNTSIIQRFKQENDRVFNLVLQQLGS